MATTTWAGASGIGGDLVTEFRALTPTSLSDTKFDLAPPDDMLRDWALRNPGACFRRFQLWADSYEEAPYMAPTEFEIAQTVTLTVAYPRKGPWGLNSSGGSGLYFLEQVIEEDLFQLRDSVFSASNYGSGVQIREFQSASIDRGDAVWFVTVNLLLRYRRSQSLL